MAFQPQPLPTSVPTVADLATSRSRTANGAVVSTTGYSTAGDGGAVSVISRRTGRSLLGGSANDRVRYFNGPGVDDYWETANKSQINLLQAGCVGDGVTDDTARFIAAVTAALASNVPLKVPKGNYLLSSLDEYISLTGSLTIIGDGYQSKIIGPNTGQGLFYINQDAECTLVCESLNFSTFYTVFQFANMSAEDPHTITIRNNVCDNFGSGICNQVGGGKIRATAIQVDGNRLTNMGLSTTSVRPWAIDLGISECPKTNVTDNLIDGVGSLDVMDQVIAIWVDCTGSTDDAQSVVISNNIIKNVLSSTRAGTDQIGAIFALECHPTITGNVIDTVAGMAKASFTVDAGTNVFTSNTHRLENTNTIRFYGDDLPAPLVEGTLYYVIDKTTNTWKVSETSGGAEVNITDVGSGAMTWFAPHPSSPEAIYTKSSHAVVSNNTIIDVIGAEGVINMKGELSGSASAEGSVISGNSISFRDQPVGVSCTGINLAAPNISCIGNVVEGVSRGIVAIYDGCIISNNVLRNLQAGGVEFVTVGTDYNLTVKDNIFTGIGQGAAGYGVVVTGVASYGMDLLEITNNTFTNFTGDTNIGVNLTNISTAAIRKAVVNGNRFNNLDYTFLINADAAQDVDYVEFSYNSIYNPTIVFQTVATHKRVRKLMNTVNGSLWDGNDLPYKFDPTSITGCASWWKMTGDSLLTIVSPEAIANQDGQSLVRIKDRSGNGNHLDTFGGGQPPVFWYGSQHSLPANSVRFNASDMNCTLPAACKASANNTLFMAFRIDADTKFLWFYQFTTPDWSSATTNYTFFAEEGNTTDPGKGLNVGTPTFRVNGAVADFSLADDVFNETGSGLVIVTVRDLDLTTWDDATGKFYLGGYPGNLWYVNQGNLFEVMLYSSDLTDAEVNQVETYLADEYEVAL